ncbi:hypothetical protein GW17_00060841 [Ensete ventricosum]|nr:hypothetical protein GW17_00060841 [Ensete ventricosum]
MDQRRPELGVIPLIHEVPRRDPSRGGKNDRVPNGPVRLIQARARWTATTTLRRKPRQPEGPSRRPIWNPRWRYPNTTQPGPCPLMRHGDPCPDPMPLQPHVLRTSRPYPEGRLSELDEPSVLERQRGFGGLTFQSTKRSDSGSSPPNRLEGASTYFRGSSGRWDARSSGPETTDGDLPSNREASMQGYAGSSGQKARATSHFQLNRTSEPYQPPRPYKVWLVRQ